MPTIVPTLVDGDDFTDDFTLAVKAAIEELQQCYVTTAPVAGSGITSVSMRLVRKPALVGLDLITMTVCAMTNSTGGAITNGQTLLTVPSGFRPVSTRRLSGYNVSTGSNNFHAILNSAGVLAAGVGGNWVAPTNGQGFGFYSAVWETTDPTP